MNVSILLAHPSESSLSHALARRIADVLVSSGHIAQWHHLEAEDFDPRLTVREIVEHRSDDPLVERHCRELSEARGLVLVHPVWFAQPPALMKGWVDRTVREGVAFRRKPDGTIEPLLAVHRALVVTTANMSYDRERGDDLDRFWRDVVLRPCGVREVQRLAFAPVVSSTAATRAAWLEQAGQAAQTLFAPASAPVRAIGGPGGEAS